MAGSLFDQLKKSGLVDEKKARQVKKDKYKQAKQQKGKKARPLDESKQRAQVQQAEKAARDRALNQQQKDAAEKKAIAAQIKQLIVLNRIDLEEGQIAFNFTDGSSVQHLYVTDIQKQHLTQGRLAIVKSADRYEVVPAPVAEKIGLRDPSSIVINNVTTSETVDADDPYADYKIPDDLMW